MIEYVVATKEDIELLMKSRLEMLRVVNELPCEYKFSKYLLDHSLEYFKHGNQTTVLALDGDVIGCATICYIEMMPTFSHPTGKRAHLMNVYTRSEEKGATEISLDATEMGKPLYRKCNFVESGECMVLNLS
jgi:hypothetical protein